MLIKALVLMTRIKADITPVVIYLFLSKAYYVKQNNEMQKTTNYFYFLVNTLNNYYI